MAYVFNINKTGSVATGNYERAYVFNINRTGSVATGNGERAYVFNINRNGKCNHRKWRKGLCVIQTRLKVQSLETAIAIQSKMNQYDGGIYLHVPYQYIDCLNAMVWHKK
jgi:hypothetical protein